ncbi:hypothetical protein [Pseudodesulfovibrio sp.]|uniref:hypothetical protein n=1 Tax=unclassified Pseudodesulfovibrio TaxID=2661612 RepID=UPI003B002D60
MEITASTGSAIFGDAVSLHRSSGQNGFGKLVTQSLDEQEAEQRQNDQSGEVGIGAPGPTPEQQRKIERLKNEAMQIAAKSEGELTAGDESRIRNIQGQIRKLGGMPMSENVAAQAKQSAKSNKIKLADPAETGKAKTGDNQFQTMNGGEWNNGSLSVGQQMLHQQALVTAIKGTGLQGAGIQASNFKSMA